MNRSQLLELLSLRTRSTAELATAAPALAEEVRRARTGVDEEVVARHLAREVPRDAPAAMHRRPIDGASVLIESPPTDLASEDAALSDVRLADDPELEPILARAHAEQVLALAGIAEGRVEPERVSTIDEAMLLRWVDEQRITDDEARSIGLTATLYRLLDHDPVATASALRVRSPRVLEVTDSRDLAALTREEWQAGLAELGDAAAPTAEMIAGALAALHPADALIGRLRERDETLERVRRERGADADLLSLDYSAGSRDVAALELGALGISADDQRRVVRALAAIQRVHAVAADVDEARAALDAGYTSASAIARSSKTTLHARTGLSDAAASEMWSKAQASLGGASLTATAINDLIQKVATAPWNVHVSDAILDQLRQLDGFDELFGRQTYCACEHCASIFSPAAYFVDTMAFVDQHIRSVYFSGAHQGHPLDLRSRRPDLWTVPLTCANTDERIPTLDIVNEVLENYIARARGFAGDLSDRAAVQTAVYENALAVTADSYRQPFSLALRALEALLVELGARRDEAADALGVTGPTWTRAVLGLSSAEFDLVTTPAADLTTQRRLTGIQLTASIGAIDVELIIKATGDRRAELGDLVATWFVRGTADVKIVAAKSSPNAVQFDIERVHGLTLAVLDRMHRFTRLRRLLGLRAGELDYFLRQRSDSALDDTSLAALARVVRLQRRLGTSIEETIALFAVPASFPAVADQPPLFDRVFNVPVFVTASGAWPAPATRFVHPVFRAATPDPGEPLLVRLGASLGLDIERLGLLIDHLAAPLGFSPQAVVEDERGFFLTRENLSLLHRHARLSALLRLPIPDLFRVIELAGIAGGHVSGIDTLEALLRAADAVRAGGRTLDQLAIALGQAPLDPAALPDAAKIAVTLRTAAAESLTFDGTLFAVQLGVSEAASLAIVAANPGMFEPAGDAFRLVAGDDGVSPLAIPPGVPVTSAQARQVLLAYHPREVALAWLAAELDTPLDRLRALAAMSAVSLDDAAFAADLRGDGAPGPLEQVIRRLQRLSAAFPARAFDAAALALVRAHLAAFGIADVNALQWANLASIDTYARLATRSDELGQPIVDAADLRDAITAYSATGFAASSDAPLGRILGVGAAVVATLRPRVPLGAHALATLDRLEHAARLTQRLGVDGKILEDLTEDTYADQRNAAAALRLAIVGKAATDAERAERLARVDDPLRLLQRDALADFIVHAIHPELEDRRELYPYFLLDVDVDSCATTSRIVAATASVQLYVQRVLLNLEQDRRDVTDPQHVHVKLGEEAAAEWEWRKNYRVWEANRKVFLYPETYLEPDLRDDKTPLFRELEQNLLQQDVTDQSVLDAYAAYLAGFQELANLTIAGAYHETQRFWAKGTFQWDKLHLFGVTSTDPPVHYYRTAEDVIVARALGDREPMWGPWQKITASIPSRRVSPVVHKGRLYLFWPEIKTRARSAIKNGSSEFNGYQHTMSLRATTLRLDGTWAPPQAIRLPSGGPFEGSPGLILDPLQHDGSVRLDPNGHDEPQDGYTLDGVPWEWVWPESYQRGITLMGRNFFLRGDVDPFARRLTVNENITVVSDPQRRFAAKGNTLYLGKPFVYVPPFFFPKYPRDAFANTIVRSQHWDEYLREVDARHWEGTGNTSALPSAFVVLVDAYQNHVADLKSGTQLLAVPGLPENLIVQRGPDVLHLVGTHRSDGRYDLFRIGTTRADAVARTLFEDGYEALLSLSTQRGLKEGALPLTLVGSKVEDRTKKDGIDFAGAYGMYYREIFFHVPWLIANHLNALGHYASADRWYRYIFDPTATEDVDLPQGLSKDERARRLRDRVWRYLELRGLTPPQLRDVLTDPRALEAYRRDPFNPFAIARLRPSAFQKAIVMNVVDNLLDWADHLFTQFTMESINEASMLYAMAADILGPRPPELGDCGEASPAKRDYEHIAPLLDDGGVLAEIETWSMGQRIAAARMKAVARAPHGFRAIAVDNVLAAKTELIAVATTATTATTTARAARQPAPSWARIARIAAPRTRIDARIANEVLAADDGDAPRRSAHGFLGDEWRSAGTAAWAPPLGASKQKQPSGKLSPIHQNKWAKVTPGLGWSLVRQLRPVFCVPPNKDLLALWDRVEDRQFKIRHCMDITGQRREVALFAPEIDPRLLVRMRAAGLSLDEVLSSTSGQLPPYRFTFLIDRAKAYAGALQAFGQMLLGALEKKDAEELALLRQRHQQNLARLSTQLREWEIKSAEEGIATLGRQLEAATYRRDYFRDLIDTGLNGWEHTQAAMRWTIAGLHGGESVMQIITSIMALIPNAGAPTAMTYGGKQLAKAFQAAAGVSAALAKSAEAVANAVGLQAGFSRREDGWDHAKQNAEHEIKSLQRQLAAAELRKKIAERSLRIHEETMEQLDDVYELMSGKFTNLGRYGWLAGQLKTLFRAAYTNALGLARLAEEAFRFERDDQLSAGLAPTYWDPTHAGLLAGDRLLIDLQSLERRFLDSNHRTLEVDQTFSLQQLDPAALVRLRETGACDFTIPEIAFDLYYPGQYRRRIKGVRVTIPCITGPFTNVSTTLALKSSWLRRAPSTDAQALVAVPPRRSTTIATSTGQNDGGVFELSFRDDRYMPFEGAGAISQWRLELPKSFRPFDYQTITDVVLSISYSALHDGVLKDKVEDLTATIEGSIAAHLATTPLRRIISLRQEFSGALSRLLHSVATTQVPFELADRHLPVFMRGRALTVDAASLVLRVAPGVALSGVSFVVDGVPVAGFAPTAALGNLPSKSMPAGFIAKLLGPHTIAVQNAAGLAPESPLPQDPSALSDDKLLDILIVFDYRLATS